MVNAIQNAVTNVAVDITLKASDPRVRINNTPDRLTGSTGRDWFVAALDDIFTDLVTTGLLTETTDSL